VAAGGDSARQTGSFAAQRGVGVAVADPDIAATDPGGRPISPHSFDDFYAATVRRTTGQIYAMTGNLAEAQDCVQDAYARAWLRWDTVREHPDPLGWVRTTAWRLAVSRFRRTVRGLYLLREQGLPANAPEPSPNAVAISVALKAISAEQRRVIVLHYLLDMSVEDIAHEIGAPVGTVKARLSRGRTALAPLLVTDQGDDDA